MSHMCKEKSNCKDLKSHEEVLQDIDRNGKVQISSFHHHNETVPHLQNPYFSAPDDSPDYSHDMNRIVESEQIHQCDLPDSHGTCY